MVLGIRMANLTIHSCAIYSPSHVNTIKGIYSSLSHYVEVEGWEHLLDVVAQGAKSELLRVPPFYSNELIQGKKLLMVGGGYIPEFLSHAKLLGVEIYLLDDPKMAHRVEGRVTRFIPVSNFGRVSITDPEAVLNTIKQTNTNFDGVFTLVEDEGPLTAFLARSMNLTGNSEEASWIARNKYKMRNVMRNANLPVPKFALVEKEEDLKAAAETVGFPSFLKPVFGVAASFASKVENMDELKKLYKQFQDEMDPSNHSIYWYGEQMILEEMLEGTEIQLEMLVHKGKIVFHCFSSQYSTHRDWLVFPVNLTEQQKDELFNLAAKTVHAIGLTHGVVHIEMFYTPKGPQMIELNNRLSRGFLPRRFTHQLLFGEKLTDYFADVIYLALGMEPPAYNRTIPPLSIAIFLENPSANGWETEGPCSIFFGADPSSSLEQGLQYQALPSK